MERNKIEILAPAGSYESLKAAVCAGADAVYIGGSRFGARAYAENLTEEDMLSAIDYVHLHGRKIYLTVNTLLKDDEIEELYDYLLPYYRQGLDAVIVQDVGALQYIREHFPDLAIHVSTQMTVTGYRGASFFKEQGAERIVLAREISLEEVRQMKDETGLEIECFVHGALCYCYSGQCLMSSMIGGRSGNRGQCAQPCRLPYSVDGRKPQDILSLKDLCTIDMIPELIEAGIDSFKIEGRMKQPDYVYTVVSLYRKYVDLYKKSGKAGFSVTEEDKKRLLGVYRRRGYTEGYYKQQNGKDMISLKRPSNLSEETANIGDLKIQEKINGELILSEGECAKLSLEWHGHGRACAVEVTGEVVQTAKNQPLEAARVEKQMRKTGNTEFAFDKFDVELKGNVFLPMQALNELRREGIQKLADTVLEKHRRGEAVVPDEKAVQESFVGEDTRIAVLVSETDQFREVLGDDRVSVIYVDSQIGFHKEVLEVVSGHTGEQKIYLAMPYIFREKTVLWFESYFQIMEEVYDGVLVRNWESYVWLKEHGYKKVMISDYNLYVFNQKSKQFMKKTGLDGYTASVELNYRELKNLDISDGTLIVYGYQPVMITANCIKKSTDGCTHKEGVTYLSDRYQKKFAVKNCCKYCYNVIYNSAPLLLLSQAEEVERLHPLWMRLDFTTETAREIKNTLDLYENVFLKHRSVNVSDMEYTKGHFKRGVK